MDSRPLVLITDAPLDAHTTELLRGFDPSDEVVGAEGSAADALRSWSQAARRCSGRLVIVDSRMHAEQQALANLLDVPGRGTSVLLAHNGDDSVDVPINVADGYVVPRGGTKLQAAGILVVSAARLPGLRQRHRTGGSGGRKRAQRHGWCMGNRARYRRQIPRRRGRRSGAFLRQLCTHGTARQQRRRPTPARQRCGR